MVKKTFPFLICAVLLAIVASCVKSTPAPTTNPTVTRLPYPILTGLPEETTTTEETVPAMTYPVTTETTPVDVLGLPIYRISIFPNKLGWGVNLDQDAIYHTIDGGTTWTDVSPAGNILEDAVRSTNSFFLDGQNGWLSVSNFETSSLYHTSDGGMNWEVTELQIPGGSLYFLDAKTGFMLSSLGVAAGSEYVSLSYTQDAGLTWQQHFTHEPGGTPQSLPEGGSKIGFTFLDDNTGWVGGTAPITGFLYLYQTSNGGELWQETACMFPFDTTNNFFETNAPIFVDQTHGFLPMRALGNADDLKTLMCITVDAGRSWTYTSSLALTSVQDFTDPLNGWALSDTALYQTTDGAKTWVDLSAGLPQDYALVTMDFINPQTGYLVVTSPDMEHTDENHLYSSSDGGQTWQLIPALITE